MNMERTIVTNVTEKKAVHIFVSGSIGVGKSTVLAYLKNRWVGINGLYFIKEYIDYDPDGKDYSYNRINTNGRGTYNWQVLTDEEINYLIDYIINGLNQIIEKQGI